ncbi:dipeptide epimerase [Arachidicoccus ginsenosidimutans]|uniref:mandelate racemase/muconate lactonizing enzyme family protein n=1 Tax=Arachidicoccus sp. BS20 TaxID=1850526 RepID=UPI0007F0BC6A|nr:dipeptide epimerase [Arachidicoccus sp. BS20]ANI90349.1 dipeptide epimerase [Arachidicoccus sp. BS20]
MKITHTEIYRFSIPMVPFAIATGTMDYAQNVFIRIYTDEGFYGVGECSAFPMIVGETQDTCLVLAKEFAKLWKGKNPLEIEERLQELDWFIAKNTTIKSAFDMALYDIAAKAKNVPLYQFLGGEPRPIVTDITVGISSPEKMAAQALEFKNNNAEVLKVKLGKNPDEDIERIKTIREAIGFELPIRIDANQGWNYDDALQALKALEKFNIEFCEQPMRTYDDKFLPELRSKTSIKIMADESCYNYYDAEKLIEANACDYINIKFSKSGGITEAKKIHDVAAQHNIPCMMGGMLESRIALSAKVHFAYTSPNIQFYDMDTCMLGQLEDPAIEGVQFNGYHISLPELPGIGADANESFLNQCEKWIV